MKYGQLKSYNSFYILLSIVFFAISSCEKVPGRVVVSKTSNTTSSTGSTGSSGSTGGSGSSTPTLPNASGVAVGAKNTFIYRYNGGAPVTVTLSSGLNTFAGDPNTGTTYLQILKGNTMVNLNFDGAATGTFTMSKLSIGDGTNNYEKAGVGKAAITVYNVQAVLGTIQGTFYTLADNNFDKNYVVLDGSFNLSAP